MYQNRLKAIKQKQAEALDRSRSFIENLLNLKQIC